MVSNTIQFLFENKIYKIKNPDPNKTILDYVRDDLKKTGTKEGCAEGGCGACTIVLGELNKNKLIYKAINACISFLPTLNGKHLIFMVHNVDFVLQVLQCLYFQCTKIIQKLVMRLLKRLCQVIYVDVLVIDRSLMLQKV